MRNKREELTEYIDSCLENDIPMNVFTYGWFRLTRGLILRDYIMNFHRRLVRGV